MKTEKHISGVFLCICGKAKKPDKTDSDTRIFVMDTPLGNLYHGLLSTKIVRSLSLRDYISFDIRDYGTAKPEEVFKSPYYKKKPKDVLKVSKSKVDLSLLDI